MSIVKLMVEVPRSARADLARRGAGRQLVDVAAGRRGVGNGERGQAEIDRLRGGLLADTP